MSRVNEGSDSTASTTGGVRMAANLDLMLMPFSFSFYRNSILSPPPRLHHLHDVPEGYEVRAFNFLLW